jgi:hypothetical protein
MATANLNSFPSSEEAVCPSCGSIIKLYDPAGSEFCVCSTCNTYVQFKNDVPHIVKKLKFSAVKPVLPIGTEGVLQGYKFKVIAYIEKNEQDPEYAWREYLLYNYEKGYANLSEFDGHWNFVIGVNFLPDLKDPQDLTASVKYQDVIYKLFHKYPSKITSVTGEFDWDIVNDNIYTHEFIAPPYVIIKEVETGNRIFGTHYYRGEYQEPKVIAAAFGIDDLLLPSRKGIGSNQPSKAFEFWEWILRFSLYALLILMLTTLAISILKRSRTVFEQTFPITYEPIKGQYEFKPFMTPGFVVDDASFMDLRITSPVDNNWLEATIILVNEQTNETWEVTKGVEHYTGVEDGEQWAEGDISAEVLLSEIPKGRYHLNVYTASGDPLRDTLSIRITNNGILWRNLLICVVALTLIPLISWYMARVYEKRRWFNSDYSPFEY